MPSYYNKIKKSAHVFCICMLIFYESAASVFGAQEYDALPKIVIVTLGGVRNAEFFSNENSQTLFPKMWERLIPEGTLYKDLYNTNCEFHMPSVQAINTGDRYAATWRIFNPTLFHYLREQYHIPQQKLWMVGHWYDYSYKMKEDDTLSPCAFSVMSPELDQQNEALVDIMLEHEKTYNQRKIDGVESKVSKWPVWDSMSDIYHTIMMRIFRVHQPILVHYVMSDMESAHYGNYARYVLSLRAADEKIADIWEFIQKHPAYKNNTYLIVNVDHTRDLYYRHHYKSDEPVWMYVYGPDIKKGYMSSEPIEHIDIFTTVADIMKLRTHTSEGKVLKDCF